MHTDTMRPRAESAYDAHTSRAGNLRKCGEVRVTVDMLAGELGVARTTAQNLLSGRVRWTPHYTSRLTPTTAMKLGIGAPAREA